MAQASPTGLPLSRWHSRLSRHLVSVFPHEVGSHRMRRDERRRIRPAVVLRLPCFAIQLAKPLTRSIFSRSMIGPAWLQRVEDLRGSKYRIGASAQTVRWRCLAHLLMALLKSLRHQKTISLCSEAEAIFSKLSIEMSRAWRSTCAMKVRCKTASKAKCSCDHFRSWHRPIMFLANTALKG